MTGGNEEKYGMLEKATITFDFIQSNSTAHIGPFSAIAELVDNAYDASASNLTIDFVDTSGISALRILDDGVGMSPQETRDIVAFGHSRKADKTNMVGRYGNGLKSGAFHLGSEFFLLTKHVDAESNTQTHTVLLISSKFHSDNGLKSGVFVPCPSFDGNGYELPMTVMQKARHEQEMEIIRQYGPLGGRSLQSWFNDIPGENGTLILISGLQRTLNGDLSFNTNDPYDITLDGDDLEPWQSSLRFYLSILYLDARMNIVLRGKEVIPRKVSGHWMFRRNKSFKGNEFKGAFLTLLGERVQNIEMVKKELSQHNSAIGTMNVSDMSISREARIANSKTRNKRTEIVEKINQLSMEKQQFEKAHKVADKLFNARIGLNIVDRQNYGINFYINKRLIIGNYRKLKFYKQPNSIGVSMFLDLDYSTFLPANNKQGFHNQKEFQLLVRKCNETLTLYDKYLMGEAIPHHLESAWQIENAFDMAPIELWSTLWSKMGYQHPTSPHSLQKVLDTKQREIIGEETGFWRLCTNPNCRKWRKVDSLVEINGDLNINFICSDVIGSSCADKADQEIFRPLQEPKPIKQHSSFSTSDVARRSNMMNAIPKREPTPDISHRKKFKVEPFDEGPDSVFEIDRMIDRNSDNDQYGYNSEGCFEDCGSPQSIEIISSKIKPRTSSRRKSKRLGSVKREADFEQDEEEEEEVISVKRSRIAVGSTSKAASQTKNREKWLEEKLNEHLVALGKTPLRKNETRDIDGKSNVETYGRRRELKGKNSVDRLERMTNVMSNLLQYLKTIPEVELQIPDVEPDKIFSVLTMIDNQLKKL
uniref:CW-type domain-containing protein n=3 Tax=Caenorhabditis japonica TaxID=281687 RepID=A0A8R1DXS8_CAEJA